MSSVDEAMIQMCDSAYDRAKMQVKMSEFREKKMNSKSQPAEKKEKASKLFVKVNAEGLRLSHILEMKKLFRSHSGTTPVEIAFCINEAKIGVLSVDSQWGIQFTKQFEDHIRQLFGVESITLG